MPRLFVRKAAKADVAEAFSWYEARRTGSGPEFLDEISVSYEAIEGQPRRFQTILDDIQMAVVHRFPYLVYFVALRNRVSVLAVLHARRDPQVWQRRR